MPTQKTEKRVVNGVVGFRGRGRVGKSFALKCHMFKKVNATRAHPPTEVGIDLRLSN